MLDDHLHRPPSVRSDPPAARAVKRAASANFEGEPSEPKRRGRTPKAGTPAPAGGVPETNPAVAGAQLQPGIWKLVAAPGLDSTLREYMEASEPIKANRTDKRTQIQRLKNEYLRLNQPMAECSLLDLVRRVEIEFSKNKQFEVQK
ncbi:hypothetical protein AK812_SmicGene37043, partial [Symbiodinium microadriaticum]